MKKYSLFIVFIISLNACNANMELTTPQLTATPAVFVPNASESECLPPLENFSFFPSGGERQGPEPILKLPADNWMPVASIPIADQPNDVEVRSTFLETIQHIDGKDRVWVHADHGSYQILAYYTTKDNQWQVVRNADWDVFFPDKQNLFVDNNNNVWMTRSSAWSPEVNADTPILAMFSKEEDKFNTVFSTKDFIDLHTAEMLIDIRIVTMKKDSAGNFWFMLKYRIEGQDNLYELYTFKPSTRQLDRHLPNLEYDNDNSASFVITPDDVLFLLDEKNSLIIRYTLVDGAIENIKIPDQVVNNTNMPTQGLGSPLSALFLDSDQRLWLDDRGWLDLTLDGDWHIVIRSPSFIEYINSAGLWHWGHPVFLNESRDGRLWYLANNRGTGWVDPKQGKWCLFTSYPSNIAKDSSGDLWMVANGKLYKYTINP